MTETNKRIISALVLFLIFTFSIILFDRNGLLGLLMVAGVLCVDELQLNFLKKKRQDFSYLISQVSFTGVFVFFNFIEPQNIFFLSAINGCFILNVLLLIYLFTDSIDKSLFKKILAFNPAFIGLFFAFPFLALSWLVHQNNWVSLICFMLILNFSVDTGAWFFGRKYGRKKLWPAISPNKTINGTLGGILSAVLFGAIYSFFNFQLISVSILCGFILLGFLSQAGDLVQSKLKRQFEIKDSSQLIPGHGGVYDRLDSLLFVAPFFIVLINLFYI